MPLHVIFWCNADVVNKYGARPHVSVVLFDTWKIVSCFDFRQRLQDLFDCLPEKVGHDRRHDSARAVEQRILAIVD